MRLSRDGARAFLRRSLARLGRHMHVTKEQIRRVPIVTLFSPMKRSRLRGGGVHVRLLLCVDARTA
jgi:hypothetical protein